MIYVKIINWRNNKFITESDIYFFGSESEINDLFCINGKNKLENFVEIRFSKEGDLFKEIAIKRKKCAKVTDSTPYPEIVAHIILAHYGFIPISDEFFYKH